MASTNPAIDEDDFAEACLDAARDSGTNAYYLIAVAFVESGIQNIPSLSSNSTAFGPFQITDETWQTLAGGLGLTDADRIDPLMQPAVAAVIAANGTNALMQILPDNRLPTAQELYFVHLFGQHGATVILGNNPTTSIRDALLQVFAGPNAQDKADAVISANKSVMTDAQGQPVTIAELLAAVGTRLDQGLTKAAAMIAHAEPSLAAGGSAPGLPPPNNAAVPWMNVADQELAAGINSNSPRIADYFTATTDNPAPAGSAWCAAFTAFCVFNCGDPARHKVESARAADWLNVGTQLNGPQYGAVAVFEPLVAGTSGHVGFVQSWAQDTLQVIGGDQRVPGGGPNVVSVATFKMTEVRGWRMP
jgi:uncharacterized protein (TIGR02594 family)